MPTTLESTRETYETRQTPTKSTFDLLRVPLLGAFLRWRYSRMALQFPLFVLATLTILHGLFGPTLAPKNLATLLVWVHYRGALVLVLLIAGNFFCMGCPFLLPRELARRLFQPLLAWPRVLRNKWLAIALLVLVLFAYELFGLWSAPWWTAVVVLAYFVGAFIVDAQFKGAPFCKYVCPIGQFNFVAATISPLEVRVRDLTVCTSCHTKDCIRGRHAAPQRQPVGTTSHGDTSGVARSRLSLPVVQRGCELGLFQPLKVGNMDCTFCLDCVYACPHDNIGIVARWPASELSLDTPRSGVGRLAQRKDLAALVLVFTFGALLNAFGMVSPVYAVQAWLSRMLGLHQRGPILGILFAAGLLLEPALLLSLAAWATRRWTDSREGLLLLATRYAYSLVPLGLSVWVAHYAFHFFTGFLTFIPVTQNALVDLGWPLLGQPNWQLGGVRPATVYPLEIGMVSLGLIGSWIVGWRLASQDRPSDPMPAALPWGMLSLILWLSAAWLLSQPMEMRGTFLGGG
jgi:polyferredoxin